MKIPEMHEVKSSYLAKVAHEGDRLHVAFRDGSHFVYHGVDHDTYVKLHGAESIGKFFAAEIKGKFRVDKLDAAQS